MSDSDACQLCGRTDVALTRHHLIPKSRTIKKKGRRDFDWEAALQNQALLCRPCHSQAHKILSERAMEREYATIEALASHPEMRKFTDWIRNKPGGLKPQMRRWRGKKAS